MATPLRRVGRTLPLAGTPGKPRVVAKISVDELRKKLSAASGGVIPATLGYSNNEVVKKYAAKIHNRSSAIRAKCIECSNGSLIEVAECTIEKCALHPFRMGKDPFNKKTRAALEGPHEEAEGGGADENEDDTEE